MQRVRSVNLPLLRTEDVVAATPRGGSHEGAVMVEEAGFDSHGTRCAAWYLRAETDALTGARGPSVRGRV